MEFRTPKGNVVAYLACAIFAGTGCGGSQSGTIKPDRDDRSEMVDPPVGPSNASPSQAALTLTDVGLVPATLDRDSDACDDFYQFACGNANGPSAFAQIATQTRTKIAATIAELPITRGLLESCQNTQETSAPQLNQLLAPIRRMKTKAQLATAIANVNAIGVPAVFTVSVAVDPSDATQNILHLDSGALGLPTRDIYIPSKDNPGAGRDYAPLRKRYQDHLGQLLSSYGIEPRKAKTMARNTLAVESQLARWTRRADETLVLSWLKNRKTIAQLDKANSEFAWREYLRALGVQGKRVNVVDPRYMEWSRRAFRAIDMKMWRHYLETRVISELAHLLPERVSAVRRKFAARARKPGARKHDCIDEIVSTLPARISTHFVDKHFPSRSKSLATSQVQAIRDAMVSLVRESKVTSKRWKDAALDKLGRTRLRIGAPDDLISETPTPSAGFLETILRRRRAQWDSQAATTGAARANSWPNHFIAVQATGGYSGFRNEVVFSAAVLQPPIFDAKHSVVVNLGRLSLLAGHELSHALDDQGANFDGDGTLKRWWNDDDERLFEKRTTCLIQDVHTMWKSTAGPDIIGELHADVAGTLAGYKAFARRRDHSSRKYVADGLSEAQQFFVALASPLCGHKNPTGSTRLPPRQRLNTIVRHVPAFSEAFQCQPGAKMRAQKLCEIY